MANDFLGNVSRPLGVYGYVDLDFCQIFFRRNLLFRNSFGIPPSKHAWSFTGRHFTYFQLNLGALYDRSQRDYFFYRFRSAFSDFSAADLGTRRMVFPYFDRYTPALLQSLPHASSMASFGLEIRRHPVEPALAHIFRLYFYRRYLLFSLEKK